MSIENKEQCSVTQTEESGPESLKHPRRSYTREFLLSLSELDICKKLPNGFDESILSEFDEASHGIQDRQRTAGGSSTPGFRYTGFGSGAPARGDSGNYPRGLHRWDSRSSGRSDSDTDSESGRRYGNQTRRSWQNSEHDGLLGSGSFPRPPGYPPGASASRSHANDHYHMNKSNEPYHPPRPYKAVPHLQRNTNDSYNDETFGSTECTSEDRVEEERKRRAEFELMRKEHQKELQEKQRLNPGKLKLDPFSDISASLETPVDDKKSCEVNKPVIKPALLNDSVERPVSSQTPQSRPLVPPGFAKAIPDRNPGAKSLAHASSVEVEKCEDMREDGKKVVQQIGFTEQQRYSANSSANEGEQIAVSSLGILDSDRAIGIDTHSLKSSSLSNVSKIPENGEIKGLDTENVAGNKINIESGRSTSLLEKLFGSALTATNGRPVNDVEGHDTKTDNIERAEPADAFKSKFSHWFLEDEKNLLEDTSSENSNDLLSLIAGSEKGTSRATEPRLPPERGIQQTTSNLEITKGEISGQLNKTYKPEPNPAVLTCEDLEQSILSEIGDKRLIAQASQHDHGTSNVNPDKPNDSVNNHASQHLLSLLQKGTVSNYTEPTSSLGRGSHEKHDEFEVRGISAVDTNAESPSASGKSLTLETLFGTAFMKELLSVEAPVSAHRKSSGSARVDVLEPCGQPFPISDGDFLPSEISNIRKSQEIGVFASNDRQRTNLNLFSELQNDDVSKFGDFGRGFNVRLPKEDSLITISNPVDAQSAKLLSSTSNMPVNIAEKLAALGASLKDERPLLESSPFPISSSQFDPSQMNPGTPLFHPLDSHPIHFDPPLAHITQKNIIHHDAPPHHQFTGHPPYSHRNAGLPGLDQPVHLRQMHVPGNLPSPHLVRSFSGGSQVPPQTSSSPGHIPEHNPMQGLAFGQRQPNFGALGMSQPGNVGPELGARTNPPEAFQRLLEMEVRSNPKPIHVFSPGGHSRGILGHELETGFRYR